MNFALRRHALRKGWRSFWNEAQQLRFNPFFWANRMSSCWSSLCRHQVVSGWHRGAKRRLTNFDGRIGSASPVPALASAGPLILRLRKLGGAPSITRCAPTKDSRTAAQCAESGMALARVFQQFAFPWFARREPLSPSAAVPQGQLSTVPRRAPTAEMRSTDCRRLARRQSLQYARDLPALRC
jgi:hypothetical protein